MLKGLKARHIISAMAQTLSFNLVHVVFSTKDLRALIRDDVAATLHAYLAATARELGCECFRVGGMADHVHLAIRLRPTKVASKIVSEIKTSSSAWVKTQGVQSFAWQRGYGLFSVSPADINALVKYIDEQKAHHDRRSFQDEMRVLLAKYHVEFDERYVWD
jgi:putative transposase